MLAVSLDSSLRSDLGQSDQALHVLGVCVRMVDGAEGLVGRCWVCAAWQLRRLNCAHHLLLDREDLLLLLALHML